MDEETVVSMDMSSSLDANTSGSSGGSGPSGLTSSPENDADVCARPDIISAVQMFYGSFDCFEFSPRVGITFG